MPLTFAPLLALFTLVAAEPDAPFRIARLLYADSFTGGMNQWVAELEKPGVVEARNGILHLDVPAGVTVWFRPELRGPVTIQYEATTPPSATSRCATSGCTGCSDAATV
jgi:hypothetical protein